MGQPGLPGDPNASVTEQQPGEDLATRMERLKRGAAGGAPQSGHQGEDDILKLMRGTSFGEVPVGGNFRLLPTDQEIEALITKVTPTRAKGSGNQMVALELEVQHPPEYKGVKLFDQCVLAESSLWKMKSLLSACGLLTDEGTFAGDTLQDLIDYVVRFQVRHDEYQGTTRNKVAGGYMEAFETEGLQNVSEAATGQPAW